MGLARGIVVWTLVFASIAIAAAPFPAALISPVNNTSVANGSVVIWWADAYDPDSDILLDEFDDVSNWTVASGYNSTQLLFLRDNSSYGMNWTLEDTAGTTTNFLLRNNFNFNVSGHDTFEFYLYAKTNISQLFLEFNDTHQNMSGWNLTDGYCGPLFLNDECHYTINISNPDYNISTINYTNTTSIMLWTREDLWGETSENKSVYLDGMKFVDNQTENRAYSFEAGNAPSNLTELSASTGNTNHTFTPTSGRWYYWAINVTDTVSNIVSSVWRFFSNTGPTVSQLLPNTTIYINQTLSISLDDYFTDADGDELNYTYVNTTNITISIDEATDIATITPDKAWEGTREIVFIANDTLNTVNSTFNITVISYAPTQPQLLAPANTSRQVANLHNLSWISSFDPDSEQMLFGFENTSGWTTVYCTNGTQTEFYRQTPIDGDTNAKGMNWTLGSGDPEIYYDFSPSLNASKYDYIAFYAKSTVTIEGWQLTLSSPDNNPVGENSTSWNLKNEGCGQLFPGDECFYKINLTSGVDTGVFNSTDVYRISFSTTALNWTTTTTENQSIFIDYVKLMGIDGSETTYYVYYSENSTAPELNGTTENTSYEVKSLDSTTHYWRVIAGDSTKNSSVSGTFNFVENTIPEITMLNITPSPAFTDNNLTCNYNYSDNQSDVAEVSGKVFIRWFNGSQEMTTHENMTQVNSTSTARDDTWICNISLFDGYEWSTVNTTNMTVQNTPPTISLVEDDSSPAAPTKPGSNVTFNMTWQDIDGDPVSFYVCNSTAINSTGCGSRHLCNVTNESTSKSDCQFNATDSDPGVVEYWAAGCDSANCSIISAKYKFGVAKAPYPVMLISPVNATNNTGNEMALQWASAYDPNSDFLVDNFDSELDWAKSTLGNLTLQTIFRRDNSTSGLNWTLENNGDGVQAIIDSEYTPAIYKTYGSKDISDYEFFEIYIKAGNGKVSNVYVDLWDSNSPAGRKMWASNKTDCGVLEEGDECLFRVNLSSTPHFSAGTFNKSTLQYVLLRSRETDFGNGSLSDAENVSLLVDYAKFVDTDALNVQYRPEIGNATNQTVNYTTDNITHSLLTNDGTTYYWKVQAFDESYNASYSGIFNVLENTGPVVYTALPDIVFRKNFNYTIDLYDYFNDTDGDILVFNWTNYTSINITNISQASDSYNVTLLPVANWSGTDEIVFIASDTLENINDSFQVTVNNSVPSAPVPLSPENNVRVNNNTYSLFWNASTDLDNDTIGYYLYFTNESFDYSLHYWNTTNNTNYTLGADLILDGQNYTWSVVATDWTDNSTASPVWLFAENAEPVLTNVRILPAVANKLSDLTCNFTYSDVHDDPHNQTLIKWYNGTVEITDLENQSLISSSNVSEWEIWNCTVNVTDGYEWSGPSMATRTIGDYYLPNLTVSPSKDVYNLGDSLTLSLIISPTPLNATGFKIRVVETGDNITVSGSGTQYSGTYTPVGTGTLTFEYNYSDSQDDTNTTIPIEISGSYNLTNVTVNRIYSNGGVTGNVSFILFNANNDTIDKTVYCNNSNSTGKQITLTSASTTAGNGTCFFGFNRPGLNNISVYIRDATGNNATSVAETNIDWLTLSVAAANKTLFDENEAGGANITLTNSTGNASGATILCNDSWQFNAGQQNTTVATSNQFAYCAFNFTEPGPHVINVTGNWSGITLYSHVELFVFPHYNTTLTPQYYTVNLGETFNFTALVTHPNGSTFPVLANTTHNVTVGSTRFPLTNITGNRYITTANLSTAGSYRASFLWTNETSNRSAYAYQNITVSPSYSVAYSGGDRAQVEYDWENYTFTVNDARGNPLSSITNGTCTVTSPANATNATGSGGTFSCRVDFAQAKTYTLTMTVYKDGNSGSGSTTIAVSGSGGDDGGGGGGSGGGGIVSGGSSSSKPVEFEDYPETIKISQGSSKIFSFTLENTGNITSEEAKIIIADINTSWYTSSVKSIGSGESKAVTVEFTVPEDAEMKNYSIIIKAYADICGVKVNGTYSGTSYCAKKTVTLTVVEPGADVDEDEGEGEETEVTGPIALSSIKSATSSMEQAEADIANLEAVGVSTSTIQGLLDEGDTHLKNANSSYLSGDYEGAKNYAGQALVKYYAANKEVSELVDGYLGEDQQLAYSFRQSLEGKTIPPGMQSSYESALGLIDEADGYLANGQYEAAKAGYAEAHNVLSRITALDGPEEKAEGGFSLIILLIVLIVLAALGVVAFLKKDVLLPYIQANVLPLFKDLPGAFRKIPEKLKGAPAFFKSIPARIKKLPQMIAELPQTIKELPERIAALTAPVTICKHAWPDNVRHMMENEVSVTISLYNKGSAKISYLEVEDFLPSYLYLMKETITAINRKVTPQASKVVNGTKLRWQFTDIGPSESLAIVYKIKVVPTAKVLHIPAAKLKVTIDKKSIKLKTKPFTIGVVK